MILPMVFHSLWKEKKILLYLLFLAQTEDHSVVNRVQIVGDSHPWQHKYGWYCCYWFSNTLYLLDSFFHQTLHPKCLYCCPGSWFYKKATHGSQNLGKQNLKRLSNPHIWRPQKKKPQKPNNNLLIFLAESNQV